MAIVNEVVTVFKFQGNTGKLAGYNKLATSAIKTTAAYAAAATAAAVAVGAFLKVTLATGDAQAQLSKTIGVGIEQIQTLGFAASVSGSSAQALESSLTNLSKKIGEASIRGSEDFQRLGISVRKANGEVKNADEVLLDLNRTFKQQGLTLQEQASYAEALGIDTSLIQLLNKTEGELAGLQARARALGLTTEKDAKQIVKFNDSLTTLGFGLKSVANSFAVSLAPHVANVSDLFVDFLADNRELIKKGLDVLVKTLVVVISTIVNAFKAVSNFINATVGWTPVLIALGAAFTLAFLPLVLITATIAAVILILDDLFVAFEGGESFIANFFESFLGVDIVEVVRGWLDALDNFANVVAKIFVDLLPDWAIRLISGGQGGNSVAPSTVPIAPVTQGATTNNSVSQNVNVNVASTDPLLAGNNVANALTREMADAQNQIGRGGR